MKPEEVDITKIKWAFWQKCWMYQHDGDKNTICLFTNNSHVINNGMMPVIPNEPMGRNYLPVLHYGVFGIYETFITSNGGLGVDKTRPLCEISLTNKDEGKPSNKDKSTIEFQAFGISQAYEYYQSKVVSEKRFT